MWTKNTDYENRVRIRAFRRAIERAINVYGQGVYKTAKLFGVTTSYVANCCGDEMTRNRKSAKKAGTMFETDVATYLATVLEKPVERRTRNGAKDKGDISGIFTYFGAPVVVECKNEKRITLAQYLDEAETEKRNALAAAAFVAFKREGIGRSRMGRQCVALSTVDLYTICGITATNNQDMLYGTNGIVVGYSMSDYNGQYKIEEVMQHIESQRDNGCDAFVVFQQARNGGEFVFTTLHDMASMLGFQPKSTE